MIDVVKLKNDEEINNKHDDDLDVEKVDDNKEPPKNDLLDKAVNNIQNATIIIW